MKLYQELFKERTIQAKLPRLETALTNFDRIEGDEDAQTLLLTGRIRDASRALEIMDELGVTTGYEAVALLPPPPPVNWRKRVQNWFARLEGGYTSDPHAWELTEFRKTLK